MTSSSAKLTVNYAPKIISSPQNATYAETQSAIFNCTLEENSKSVITWWYYDAKINTSDSVKYAVSVSSSAVSLMINKLVRGDEGFYRCKAENLLGAVESDRAFLTVHYPPSVEALPRNFTTNESQLVTLQCTVEGQPMPSLTWWYNNVEMNTSDSAKYTVCSPSSVRSSVASLTINKLVRSDEGFYQCKAYNSLGTAESNHISLTVNYPPNIIVSPRNETRNVGQNFTLWCKYEGKPPAKITWGKDGDILTRNSRITITYQSVIGPVNSTLTITNLVRGDQGSYTCTVNNIIGTAVSSSSSGYLDIYSFSSTTPTPLTTSPLLGTTTKKTHRPSQLMIINPNTNYTVQESESVTLLCKAYSVTPLTITWLRDGRQLQATGAKLSDYIVTSELTISEVLAKDSGIYECVARDAGKEISTKMKLIVNVPVVVAMDVVVKDKEFTEELRNYSSTQYLQFTNNLKGQISRLYKYHVGFKKVLVLALRSGSIKARFRVIFEIQVDSPSNQPKPDIKQNIANVVIDKISKTNGLIGDIRVDPESLVPLVPPPKPRNVISTGTKPTKLSLAWDPPLHAKYYAIRDYVIQYRQHNLQQWTTLQTRKTTGSYAIDNLNPDTVYIISVVAVNTFGKGVPSEIIEIKTLDHNILAMLWRQYKWAVVSVGGALVVLLVVGIFLCYRRSKRRGAKKRDRSRRNVDNFAVPSKDFATVGLEMAQLASRFREIPREQVLLGEPLGSGHYSQIVSGYLKEDKTHCALKMLKEGASHQDYKDLMNELEIMSSLDAHPNIINLIGACTVEGPLYVIIELAEHGCLLDYLRKNYMNSAQEGKEVSLLSKVDKIRIALDVAKGLEHLARHRCVQRDLAARNILLGANMTAKLTDFGLTRDVYAQKDGYYNEMSSKQKLPVAWMAPEAIETFIATRESDTWSFGVLLWEIESGGQEPFSGLQTKEILKILKKGQRLNQPAHCPDEIYVIMVDCWNGDPLRRPIIDNITSILDGLLCAARRDDVLKDISNA